MNYAELSNVATVINAIATTIYVVCTFFIVASNRKSANAAEMQVKASLKQFDYSLMPKILIDVQIYKNKVCFVVSNNGVLPATNLRITLDEETKTLIQKKIDPKYCTMFESLFIEKDLYGGQHKCYLFANRTIFDVLKDQEAKFTITFNYRGETISGIQRLTFNEEYLIDTTPMERMASSLEDIAGILKKGGGHV